MMIKSRLATEKPAEQIRNNKSQRQIGVGDKSVSNGPTLLEYAVKFPHLPNCRPPV